MGYRTFVLIDNPKVMGLFPEVQLFRLLGNRGEKDKKQHQGGNRSYHSKNIRVKLKNSVRIRAYLIANVGDLRTLGSARRCTGAVQQTVKVWFRAGCYQQFIFFAK